MSDFETNVLLKLTIQTRVPALMILEKNYLLPHIKMTQTTLIATTLTSLPPPPNQT